MLESAGLQALCYVVLLVMPVMSRMSDQSEDVRLMASRCFANLVTLMPLEVREGRRRGEDKRENRRLQKDRE